MQDTTVALLISTYNWPGALKLVLDSVLAQTKMPDEIVIAEDGTDPKTKEVIESFKNKLKLKHVRHEDEGFRKSLILNKAVKEIKSDYIIQIDGDIIVHPKFIEDHIESAKVGYFVQGSRAMIAEEKSSEILKTGQLKFNFLSSGISNRFNAVRSPSMAFIFKLHQSNPFHLKGCNFAFWKADFININGYFNGFEGWGFEDYEFGARLLHAGIKRTTIKLKAVGYHIFHSHPYNLNASLTSNKNIYRQTIDKKKTVTDNGYAQV